MKKRKIAVLIGLFACALCAAVLAACGHQHTYGAGWTYDATHHWHEATCEHTGEKDGYAEHTWDNGTVITPATCTEAGEKTYTCTVCSATKTEVIAATGHSYAKEWSSDNTHHWHAATCGHDLMEDYAEHVFEKGVCTTCGCTQPVTEGLDYTLINNDTEYEVSGIGTATGSEIFIPSAHNGLPVTSIGTGAFYGSVWIKSVFIPDSVTSIGNYAFEDCNNLTSVTIGSGVTSIGDDAFGGCHNLASIVIPGSVTSIGEYAFENCEGLTSIVIPSSVTSIGDFVFCSCYNLASITVAEGNSVYHSVGNCLIETASKTLIAGCKTSVIPADGSVTSIGVGAFIYCDGLTSVIIPDSVTSIGNYAFEDCDNLTSVTIGSGVQSIGSSAFIYCYKLVEVYNKSTLPITAGGTDHGEVARYALNVYTKEGGSQLTDTSDGYRFFYDGSKGYLVGYYGTQTALTLPASFTAYNGTLVEKYEIAERAFYNCTALKSVTIPESVTGIGDYAFLYCYGLTSIVIPDSVTSIGNGAFEYCNSLTSVTIGSGVQSIGVEAFAFCYGLSSVTIGSGVTSIGDFAFSGCINLASIVIPNNVTSIGEGTFAYCIRLTSVIIPESVTSIGDMAFAFCYGLTSVTIGSGVTSIGEGAFAYCIRLTSVIIPESVTSIGDMAFAECNTLEAVYYCGTATQWQAVTIGSDSFVSATTVYYYSETQPTEAGNWWHFDTDGVTPVKW